MIKKASSYLFTFVLATVGSLAAQWLNYPTPGVPRTSDGKPNLTAPAPRTAEGKPDFSGLWAQGLTPYGVGRHTRPEGREHLPARRRGPLQETSLGFPAG